MNRRAFLQLIGGAALATQIPAFALAEEKDGDYCVRYLRAYDISNAQMVERVDISRGGNLTIPKSVERGETLNNVDREFVAKAIDLMSMRGADIPPEAIAALDGRFREGLKVGDIIGVRFSRNTVGR